MPELDLQALPPELQAALAKAWPDCPEAQRRALLASRCWSGWRPAWPDRVWAWQPAHRWWRPWRAREYREQAEALFSDHVSDVLHSYAPRLFDPDQPFFDTPWTHAKVVLRSPAPEVFSDADFWAMTQQLFGGRVESARHEALAWARGMQLENALRGARREQWLVDAVYRLEMAATGTFL